MISKGNLSLLQFGENKDVFFEESFGLLYKDYFADLLSFVRRYVHAETIAEDIVQDIFVKLWDKKDDLTNVLEWRAYLFKMAKNRALDYLKKIKRVDYMPAEMIQEFKNFDKGVENLAIEKEYFEFLRKQFDRLPETSKNVFVLCREMGKSYEEVASELSISKNTVKHHMVSTVKWLRQEVLAKLNIDNSLRMVLALFPSELLP
jgi:RNA polymerase sigma-70 factor (family 1)